jgi:hypothetical protein
MSNKQAQAAKLTKPPTLDDFNKVEVKLTDVELQFVSMTERRKTAAVNNILTIFAEELQHAVAMLAKKKNISFDQELFAGVYFDEPKGRAYILQYKEKPQPQAAEAPAQ